jgi:putative lipase involved disintegration of autophagic bodies
MKWTPKMEDKLRKLCFEEKSNADLAKIFNCDVKDIHAARSRLGITIDKVKAAKEADTRKTNQTSPLITVKEAFDNLHVALVAAAKSDFTSNAGIYADTDTLVLGVRDIFLRSLKK